MNTLSDYLNRSHEKTFLNSVKGMSYREFRRFAQVPMQTIFAPLITVLLYYIIFFYLQRGVNPSSSVNFMTFLSIGLVAKECIQAANSNPSSSLMQAKLVGNYVDWLMAPLNQFGLWCGFLAGILIRITIVFFVSYMMVFLLFMKEFHFHSLPLLLYSFLVTAMTVGSYSLSAAIVSKTFDQLTLIMLILFQPLVYLGGVFFSIDILPLTLQKFTYLNPFFHIVNLYRAALLGECDIPLIQLILFSACSSFIFTALSLSLIFSKRFGLKK